MNLLDTVKVLLGITDDSKDAILTLYIDIAVQDVLNRTNRNELPEELNKTVARMVRLSATGALSTDFNAPVASVSEAGRSVNFATAQLTEKDIEAERKDIEAQMLSFRLPYRITERGMRDGL